MKKDRAMKNDKAVNNDRAMKSTLLRSTVLLALLVVMLSCSGDTCGPYFLTLEFTRTLGPDAPISAFTRGELGIPQKSWWREYLVVVYRYLQNKPLSNSEADSFATLWGVEESYGVRYRSIDDAVQRWLSARAHFRKDGQTPEAFKNDVENYSSSLNCLPPAFNTAIETLNARAKTFGPGSHDLNEWIDGQDAVFSNCRQNTSFPRTLPPDANPLLRSDRDYQLAAADFYRGSFKNAVAKFDAIASDSSSPWHGIASYLSVRALIRSTSGLADPGSSRDPQAVKDMQRRLDLILKDPSRSAFHHDARMLQNLLAFRLEPEAQKHRLAAHLAAGGTGEDFGQEVRDYTLLLEQSLDDQPDFPDVQRFTPEYDKKLTQWRAERYENGSQKSGDDLTDWLLTVQSDSRAATQHAMAKWRETHSQAWLFAALIRGDLGAQSTELLRAATHVPATAPGYVAINFYRAHILRSSGNMAAARKVLAEVFSARHAIPISAINLLKDEQLLASADLDSFSGLLARHPALLSLDRAVPLSPPCYTAECNKIFYGRQKVNKNTPLLQQFDPSAAWLLNNRLPVNVLSHVAQSGKLPENLKANIVLATWARAALLDKPETAAGLQEEAGRAQRLAKTYLARYAAAQSSDERRFAAAFAILHFPGLRPYVDSETLRETSFEKIDSYRNNWWCVDVGSVADESNFEKGFLGADELNRRGRMNLPSPLFLSAQEIRDAHSELKQLHQLGAAGDYLSATVIHWVEAHPDDPRAPEALHLAVRATRYGCYNVARTRLLPEKNYSREAFILLHKKYPDSPWARKTPYWF
jgi:hypothetical protein